MEPAATIWMDLSPKDIGRLVPLFGQGVGIPTTDGISLADLLCRQLEFDRDYVDDRIQTIFVNNRAVDDVERVILDNQAVIALSAAMPGLAGATLRKGGHFAGMRQEISETSRSDDTKEIRDQEIMVTLKLFNVVAHEMAGQVLARGVWVDGKTLKQYLDLMAPAAMGQWEQIRFNDQKVSFEQLIGLVWPDGWVRMQIAISSRV